MTIDGTMSHQYRSQAACKKRTTSIGVYVQISITKINSDFSSRHHANDSLQHLICNATLDL